MWGMIETNSQSFENLRCPHDLKLFVKLFGSCHVVCHYKWVKFLQNSGGEMTIGMVCLFYELPGALAPGGFLTPLYSPLKIRGKVDRINSVNKTAGGFTLLP